MNQTLSDMALRALKAKGFETIRGYCSRWARQVDEAACGDARHNACWRPDASPTAKEAAYAFKAAGLGFDYSPGMKLEIGDVLFKTLGSGGAGHVGILTPRGVAENSSYHAARSSNGDARGLRSLAQFGAFQIVARLPDPKQQPRPTAAKQAPESLTVNWNGNAMTMAQIIERGGHDVVKITEDLAHNIVWVRSTPKGGK